MWKIWCYQKKKNINEKKIFSKNCIQKKNEEKNFVACRRKIAALYNNPSDMLRVKCKAIMDR